MVKYFKLKNSMPMKCGAVTRTLALVIAAILATAANASSDGINLARRMLQENPAGPAGAGGSLNDDSEKTPGVANADQETEAAMMGIASAIYNAEKWLLEAGAEVNIGKAMAGIDEVWLSAIEAMQIISKMKRIKIRVVNTINDTVRRADTLMAKLVAMALEKAGGAVKTSMNREQNAGGQLQSLIEAIESAQIAGNFEAYGILEKHMSQASEMMQRSAEAVTKLIVEDAKYQGDSSDGMKAFRNAMKAFGRAMQLFDAYWMYYPLEESLEELKRSTRKLREAAGRMAPDAAIMNVRLLRIANAMRAAAYGTIRSGNIYIIIREKDEAKLVGDLINALDAFDFEALSAKCAEAKADEAIGDMGAAVNSSKMAIARQSIDQMKENITRVKEACRAVNRKLNTIVEVATKEKQAGAQCEEDGASTDPEDVGDDVYMLQKSIVEWRRHIMRMMTTTYALEQSAAAMEQKITGAEQEINADNEADGHKSGA